MGLFGKKEIKDESKQDIGVKEVDNNTYSVERIVYNKSLDFLVTPIMTEKSHWMSKDRKFLFKFPIGVKKYDIKKIIESKYKVDVVSINVLTVSNKKRTIKYDRGYQKTFKKAIVTLKEGQNITVSENE